MHHNHDDALVWMDLETTGLDPDRDRILEIAVLITDGDLNIVEHGPNLVIHQSDELLHGMDAWCQQHHRASGLIDRVRASTITEFEAEEQVFDFLRTHVAKRTIPLAGSSVHQDRRFLCRYMTRVESYLHYRIVDVSTIKELVRRWHPEHMAHAPEKALRHRALDDLLESITELRHYRHHVFGGKS